MSYIPSRLFGPLTLTLTLFQPYVAAGADTLIDSFGTGVAIQDDGMIIVAGSSRFDGYATAFALARYNSDGSLDPAFSGDGVVNTDILPSLGSEALAHTVNIDGNGRIIAGGWARDPGGDHGVAVARYGSDGTLDASFGTDGVAFLDLDAGDDRASDAAIISGNAIVLAGTIGSSLLLVQLDESGDPDALFGTAGIVTEPLGLRIGSGVRLAIASDGKIVVTGVRDTPTDNLIVARFDPDGELDSTFSSDGVQTLTVTPTPNSGFGYWEAALALQSDDRVIVSTPEGTLVRLDTAGELDGSFQGDGVSDPTGVSYFYDLEIGPGDAILASGGTTGIGATLARFDADGNPDGAFGIAGIEHPPLLNDDVSYSFLGSIALQADGKLVGAGTAYYGDNQILSFTAVRVAANGTLDPSFDDDGIVVESECRRIPLTSASCVDESRAWLKIRRRENLDGNSDEGSRLRWKWEGSLTPAAETPDERYTLCAYDTHGSGPALSGWLMYKETKLKPLTGGRLRASFRAGYRIPNTFLDPEVLDSFDADRFFNQDPETIVQLVRTDGLCLRSTFSSEETLKNLGDRFQARSD